MGLDPAFGTTLHAQFQRAGLGRPQLTLSAPLGTVDDADTMAFVAEPGARCSRLPDNWA